MKVSLIRFMIYAINVEHAVVRAGREYIGYIKTDFWAGYETWLENTHTHTLSQACGSLAVTYCACTPVGKHKSVGEHGDIKLLILSYL